MIDSKLKWQDHILNVWNEIYKAIGIIIKSWVLGKKHFVILS